jgi:dihydroneopterin aldolase
MEKYLDIIKYRKIFLRDYSVDINIGVHDYEKIKPQKVIINVDVYILLENTISLNDDINDIFDYDYIKTSINKIISNKHIELQETLCDLIIEKMIEHNLVYAAKVSTEKSDIYPNAKGIGVEIFRVKN